MYYSVGKNCIIADSANIGKGTYIGHNCIIEDDVDIGANGSGISKDFMV